MRTENLISVIRWREDVESGEMVEQLPGRGRGAYMKSYWSSDGPISQKELDLICKVANSWWAGRRSPLRVTNYMGEILPARRRT